MHIWHPAWLHLIMLSFRLIFFLLWHPMPTCTRLLPQVEIVLSWGSQQLWVGLCSSPHSSWHPVARKLDCSSINSSLLGIPFSFQTRYTHLEFFARLLCQASLLKMISKRTGLRLDPIFTLNFFLMMIPVPAFSSCRLIWCFSSAGRCMTLFTTSSLARVLWLFLLYSDQWNSESSLS